MRPPRKKHAAGRKPAARGTTTNDYSGSQSVPPAAPPRKPFLVVVHGDADHRILTVGADHHTPELQDALAGDRDWFATHPARRYRVRPVALGEHGDAREPGPAPTHSIVVQVRPGSRRRVPVSLNAAAISDLAQIEERTDCDEIIGNFVALLERDRIARIGDAVALAYTGGTA